MKKKLILSTLILMVVALTVILLDQNNERVIYSSKINEIPTTDALAMMYETESGSGEYIVSDDNSWPLEGYVFNAELSRCENGSKLYWDEETKSVMMEANVSDKCYVYFDVYAEPTFADICRENNSNTLACKVATTYSEDGENGLYYHDGTGTYTNADQEAGDNSYRYSGANPNNYVCFGSDAATCSNDNLYRIIGVFDGQVKLIKYDYANSNLLGTNGDYSNSTYTASSQQNYKGTLSTINTYYWNSVNYDMAFNSTGYYSSWEWSDLNALNLNENYLNNIGSEWSNLISDTTWTVGGNMDSNIRSTVKNSYTSEIVNPYVGPGKWYDAKIGLMYVSDYGYAASPENWNTRLSSYGTESVRNNNWMYMGLYEWTITRGEDDSYYGFEVTSNGGLSLSDVSGNGSIRPTFYLNSNVVYTRGSGTQTDPYRIV